MAYVGLALRLTLAAVCLAAVAGKLREPAGFARMLAEVGVPARLVPATAAAVVGTELAVAGLVLWRPAALAGSLLAAGLFAVLTAGVARAVRRGSTASCRCFGGRGRRFGRDHVVRNATLTVAALAAAASTGWPTPPAGHPAGCAGAVAVAGLATVTVVFWDDIVVPAQLRKG